MQIHQVQTIHKERKARRIGRGGKRGTYSGRGMKGQKSRAGTRFQPRVREALKRYPKLRGYKRSGYSEVVSFNVADLEKHFKKGEIVSPTTLVAKHLLGTIKKRPPVIKILGSGEITKAVTIEKCQVSEVAKSKVEKAGGTIQIV
jgi:large subunit ribosomal protein L15